TDKRAVFIVLVGRGGKNVTGHSGHGPRRNSAGSVFVTQIRLVVVTARRIRGDGAAAVICTVSTVVRQNRFAPVDLHFEVEIIRIDARGSFGNQEIGQDETGTLILVAEVEQLRDRLKQIQLVCRRDNDARIIALAGAEYLPEIAL